MHYQRWRNHGSPTAGRKPNGLNEERAAFKYFMPENPPPDGCWDWQGTVRDDGYGTLWLGGGKVTTTHRASYRLHVGELPDEMDVLHSCDRPLCVQPLHLSIGTHLENMIESAQRDRKGVKLTNAQVIEIRRRLAAGERNRPLAEEFGVTPNWIQCIATGQVRRHTGESVVETN